MSVFTQAARNSAQDAHVNDEPQHMPECTDVRRNCRVCYKKYQKEYKVNFKCESCDVYLHCNKNKNCYKEWHSPIRQNKQNENRSRNEGEEAIFVIFGINLHKLP